MAKVLVTGAGGGFGRLTVEALVKGGHVAVAALRDPEGRNRAKADDLRKAGARVVELDVTDDRSVERGVRAGSDAAGGLDVVVNNAGVGVLGIQEAFTPEDWRAIFEVNVFGVQRVNRAILPELRARRGGLLVHVSSLLGRIAMPFYGPYIASKWALEAMAENYRVELSSFGVDVAIVEPGGYPTTFIDALRRPGDASRNGTYGTLPQDAENFLKGFEAKLAETKSQDPRRVAEAIVRLVETPAGQRPFRTTVDTLGMSAAIDPYNDHLAKVTAGVYGALGIGHLLQLKR